MARREQKSKALKPSDYQQDVAYQRAIGELDKDKQEELARLTKEYPDEQKAREDGTSTAREVKEKRDAVKAFLDRDENKIRDKNGKLVTIGSRAKELAGGGFAKEFNSKLTKLGWNNFFGLTSSGLPGMISRGDKEAAAKLRESKDEYRRISNMIQQMGIKEAAGSAPPGTPPTTPTPTPPAGPPTPPNPFGPRPGPGGRGRRPAPASTPAAASASSPGTPGTGPTSSLPPLSTTVAEAIESTRHEPMRPNAAASVPPQAAAAPKSVPIPRAAPPLWKPPAANENAEELKKLSTQMRRLRETLNEMPNKLGEKFKSAAQITEAAAPSRTQERKAEARLNERLEALHGDIAGGIATSLHDAVQKATNDNPPKPPPSASPKLVLPLAASPGAASTPPAANTNEKPPEKKEAV